jgi:hypothetical protein
LCLTLDLLDVIHTPLCIPVVLCIWPPVWLSPSLFFRTPPSHFTLSGSILTLSDTTYDHMVTPYFVVQYEEIYAVECADLIYLSDNAYTREEILKVRSEKRFNTVAAFLARWSH